METDQALKSLLYFGTSSFSNKDWIGPFYPPGTTPATLRELSELVFAEVDLGEARRK